MENAIVEGRFGGRFQSGLTNEEGIDEEGGTARGHSTDGALKPVLITGNGMGGGAAKCLCSRSTKRKEHHVAKGRGKKKKRKSAAGEKMTRE